MLCLGSFHQALHSVFAVLQHASAVFLAVIILVCLLSSVLAIATVGDLPISMKEFMVNNSRARDMSV